MYLYTFFAKCNFLRGQAFECACVTAGVPQFYVNYWFIIICLLTVTVSWKCLNNFFNVHVQIVFIYNLNSGYWYVYLKTYCSLTPINTYFQMLNLVLHYWPLDLFVSYMYSYLRMLLVIKWLAGVGLRQSEVGKKHIRIS